MSIHPTESGGVSRSGPGRLGKPAATPPQPSSEKRPRTGPAPSSRDAIQISDEARELLDNLEIEELASELSPERLRQVLDRLARGFYDRPDVRDEVLRRLAPVLGIGSQRS